LSLLFNRTGDTRLFLMIWLGVMQKMTKNTKQV
jgi:hypothetical protein